MTGTLTMLPVAFVVFLMGLTVLLAAIPDRRQPTPIFPYWLTLLLAVICVVIAAAVFVEVL